MEKNKNLRKIQDLVMAIDTRADVLRFEARSILNFYNIWVKGKGDEELETFIGAIKSTIKTVKQLEKDLKNLKKLLRG
jgi:hypothetical protein